MKINIKTHIKHADNDNDNAFALNFNKKYVHFNTRTQSSWIDDLTFAFHLTTQLSQMFDIESHNNSR